MDASVRVGGVPVAGTDSLAFIPAPIEVIGVAAGDLMVAVSPSLVW